MIDKAAISIRIKKAHAKKELKSTFIWDLGSHIVQICNERAWVARKNADQRESNIDIRYFGDTVIMHEYNLISKSTKKMINSIDAIEEEERHLQRSVLEMKIK